jgi:hypothetical protein
MTAAQIRSAKSQRAQGSPATDKAAISAGAMRSPLASLRFQYPSRPVDRSTGHAAAVWTEISLEAFAGFRYVAKRHWLATEQCEIILWDGKKCGHRAAGRLLTVLTIAIGYEIGVGVETEPYGTTRTSGRIILFHFFTSQQFSPSVVSPAITSRSVPSAR